MGVKTPLQRRDESIVHEAIREAFINTLIHADYRGQCGIIIERYRDRLEFSNPGTLLLSVEQVLRGGMSECRNKTMQTMFALLGYGEKAGSGMDKIHQGWASQKWRWPFIQEQLKPDRVKLVLPMISLLPEVALERLERILGNNLQNLSGDQVQALVTADVEGSVSNLRFQQFSDRHASDIGKMLKELVTHGYLLKYGYGRWASYRLSPQWTWPPQPTTDSQLTKANWSHNEANWSHNEVDWSHNEANWSHNEASDKSLLQIAQLARTKARLEYDVMKDILIQLCSVRALTLEEIGQLIQRNALGIRNRYLSPMVRQGDLQLLFPNEPNHPKQAYQANFRKKEK